MSGIHVVFCILQEAGAELFEVSVLVAYLGRGFKCQELKLKSHYQLDVAKEDVKPSGWFGEIRKYLTNSSQCLQSWSRPQSLVSFGKNSRTMIGRTGS